MWYVHRLVLARFQRYDKRSTRAAWQRQSSTNNYLKNRLSNQKRWNASARELFCLFENPKRNDYITYYYYYGRL